MMIDDDDDTDDIISKELRNPRVKRRVKYEQAVKKLKSTGVRLVQKEMTPYGGELTGIKKNVARSVPIK